jgi:hypothetical protein
MYLGVKVNIRVEFKDKIRSQKQLCININGNKRKLRKICLLYRFLVKKAYNRFVNVKLPISK